MTREQLAHYREKLLAERRALADRILAAQSGAQQALDPLEATEERGPHSEFADNTLALGTLLTGQQREIDDALLRMELGEFGKCEACGKSIERERLEAMPSARFCEADGRRRDRRRHPSL